MKTADIGSPPRDSGQSHMDAGTDLLAEIFIGRHDIPGPY